MGGIIGMGVGAKENSHAIAHATNQQIGGINNAIGEQNQQMASNTAAEAPYTGFGAGSIGQLGDLLGLNGPDKAQAAIDSLKQSPIYQSLYNNGQEAVLQNASATGGLRGGNTETGLADFGRDTLAQTMQQMIQNLFGGAQIGQQSTGQLINVNQQGANNISSGYTSIGNALANKTLGQQQVWNNLGQQIQQMIASLVSGGMGGGAGAGAIGTGGGGGF